MRVKKLKIENYRLLKSFEIDLEESLSLVIGKNNTGKTSLLNVIDCFLNRSGKKFSYDDFNIDFIMKLKEIIIDKMPIEEDYHPIGIKLKLFIEYGENDNLQNIFRVMMDLDPDNNYVVLGYEYHLTYSALKNLKQSYKEFEQKEKEKLNKITDYEQKDLFYFLKRYQSNFFKASQKSIEYDPENGKEVDSNYIDLGAENISTKNIINFKFISAKRGVSNKESDKTLSSQTSEIYNVTEKTYEQNEELDRFKDELISSDLALSKIYQTLFKDVIEKVKLFGGFKSNESKIEIKSSLQHKELLSGNTTVMYQHDSNTSLPEYNNGLGYMNLISMIFEIEIKIKEFKRSKDEKPAVINLIFIEEPEAHTHPQMQYIFIKNIKSILDQSIVGEDGENRKLQAIITTHSSHIVAESNFDEIKYLKRKGKNCVIAKNLLDLKKSYETDPKHFQFLKQYLTLSRSEIFFADKAILIEGDTERILIPTLMKKIDQDDKRELSDSDKTNSIPPLNSQNISIIEVGAYSHIFEKFIDFVGIKSLIITDLDSVDNDSKKCKVSEATKYSNVALKLYFNNSTLEELKSKNFRDKIIKKNEERWNSDPEGDLCVVYQTLEECYYPRSFEDAFISVNSSFVKDNFSSLKNNNLFNGDESDPYLLANKCINKKTHFALDILYHTNDDFTNWEIPSYLKEGLKWLKEEK